MNFFYGRFNNVYFLRKIYKVNLKKSEAESYETAPPKKITDEDKKLRNLIKERNVLPLKRL